MTRGNHSPGVTECAFIELPIQICRKLDEVQAAGGILRVLEEHSLLQS